MAEESLAAAPLDLGTPGRKRYASESENPNQKKVALDTSSDGLENDTPVIGQYPYNVKKTCVMHDHSGDRNDPQGLNCAEFESEFGNFDSNIFIDQTEAEELLATLENLAGKLAPETQPLPLAWNPAEPPALPLEYQYPPMLGWSSEQPVNLTMNQVSNKQEVPTDHSSKDSDEKFR